MKVTTDYQQQGIDFLTATGSTLAFTYEGFKKYWDDDKNPRNVYSWILKRGNKSMKGVFGDSTFNSCKETPILQTSEPVEIHSGLSIKFVFPKKNFLYFDYTIKTNCEVLNRIDKKEIAVDSIIDMAVLEYRYNDFVQRYNDYRKKYKLGKETLKGVLSSLDACKKLLNNVEKRILKEIETLKTKTVLFNQADNIVTPSAYDLLACLTNYDPGTFENFCGDFGYDTDSRKALKTYRLVRKEWNDLNKLYNETELQQLAEIQ